MKKYYKILLLILTLTLCVACNKKEEKIEPFDLKEFNTCLRKMKIKDKEYNYKLKREREISNNKWTDEKEKREKEIARKEADVTALLEEAEANAEHIKELENKVSEIPTMLDKEYIRGKKEATAELEREHKYATELLKKDYENTIDRQNDKIELLKEEIEKVNTEKISLQEKLDQAYNQIKEMATVTVEATGGLKILGNNSNDIKI